MEKMNKYGTALRQAGFHVIPFILSDKGQLGKKAIEFLSELAMKNSNEDYEWKYKHYKMDISRLCIRFNTQAQSSMIARIQEHNNLIGRINAEILNNMNE